MGNGKIQEDSASDVMYNVARWCGNAEIGTGETRECGNKLPKLIIKFKLHNGKLVGHLRRVQTSNGQLGCVVVQV
ncbi:unnamed protein product [Dibothriocephalus latus]|uniref:Uncharacterized protein n=1 Tax=Dibothriocephalus latus TaxID=60516 RepID=A0A3P7L504_DIBLA|nr:unnamed protein product [Dibothriocephalus latus]